MVSVSKGGSEKCPYVELPLRSSLMATNAATVFLRMPYSIAMGVISVSVRRLLVHGSPLLSEANMASMVSEDPRHELYRVEGLLKHLVDEGQLEGHLCSCRCCS